MFRWADYLAVAEELVKRGQSGVLGDACFRSAISRAYYAALLTARNWIRDQLGIEPPEDAEIHRFVPTCLTESGIAEAVRLAPMLRRLKEHRSAADYNDRIVNPGKVAELSLLEASEVVGTIEGLTQG